MRRPAEFRGVFREDDVVRAVYSEAAGIAREIPLGVCVPADAADVEHIVRWARDSGTALIPRGSGTGMAGGAVGRGLIVDIGRLAAVGDVDTATRRVRAGAGAIRDRVNAAAATSGLTLPVDPSSGAYCTVGGMAATNAAGPHSLRHGPMRRWVVGLDCVFEDGTRAIVRRGEPPPRDVSAVSRFLDDVAGAIGSARGGAARALPGVLKDSSGYALADYAASGELVDLLVGSEGTLCLFVDIEIALAPLPSATSSLLGAFDSLDAAVAAAGRARAAGASACELLDRTFLDVARTGHALPGAVAIETEAVLLATVEGGSADEVSRAARSLAAAFRAEGARGVEMALDPAAEDVLWELRHAASPVLAQLDPALKSMQFIEDGAVPPERLAEYVRGVRAILAAHGVRGVIFGHAGDAHIHVNPLVDTGRQGWRESVAAILADVTELTRSLGGTLTGEHGDGRLRTPLLARTHRDPATLALYARVKAAFDPTGIFNPGVKVPLPDAQPLSPPPLPPIKYDPTLPPLPEPARSALERVQRDRLYATSRLDLIRE
ncbi:MAG: hypothetical protein NVS1B4_18400 [Gemmatimonadaceae bacterium]